jgi:hypothetical protein
LASNDDDADDDDFDEEAWDRQQKQEEEQEAKAQAEWDAIIDAEEAEDMRQWNIEKEEALQEINPEKAARVIAYMRKVNRPIGDDQLIGVFEFAGVKDAEDLIDQMFHAELIDREMAGFVINNENVEEFFGKLAGKSI